MSDKIVSTKKTSAMFLAIVLIAGTFAAISPFILGAQAQQDYGMDNRYSSYEPEYKDKESNIYESDYGMDNDNRKSYKTNRYEPTTTSYGNDNSYQKTYGNDNIYDKPQYLSYGKDKSKDSSKSVTINKVNCNNNNVNINGNNTGDINLGNKEQGYLGGYSSGGGYNGEGYYNNGFDNKKDKSFDCIINNNNTNTDIVAVGNQTDDGGVTPPPVGVKCEECFNENATLATIITNLLAVSGFIEIIPNIVIGEDVDTIAELCNFLETEIAQGDIDQTTEALSMVIKAILDSDPHQVVTVESINALVECLFDVDFPINTNGSLTLFDINTGATNTDTSAVDINTAGGLVAPSFSSSPSTIAQETTEDDLTATEKITKLKQQWMELTP